MTKIVVNKCFGGFGLSDEAAERIGLDHVDTWELDRSDGRLVAVVEELGDRANGAHAELGIVEVPDGVEWAIEECDGKEWVAESHRTWF
jgi:hypothetical protein